MEFMAVFWHDWILFKEKIFSITASALISPFMYIIAFGWGMGRNITIDGSSYIVYMLAGILTMSTATNSYNGIANDINISRQYSKLFEFFMSAPINTNFFVLSKVIVGALKGLYSAVLIILLSYIMGINAQLNIVFVILNAVIFSEIGFLAGILMPTHADISRFANFVIMPMTFLCGTFFPVEQLPGILQGIVKILPLTIVVNGIRSQQSVFENIGGIFILTIILLVLYLINVILCKRQY